jgi:uncharacterized membrane protein
MFAVAFLNPYLLYGLGGAAIPILIHLFNRRRFKTVLWGAMEFLLSSSKMTAKRLKIIQALLLLTRMGIVSFLALGLARPFLTGTFFGGALARSKSSAVIILDNSYSMGLRDGNETNFDAGKKVTEKIVASFRRGDSLTFMLMAGKPRIVAEGNPSPKRVRRLVQNSELCDERTDILAALTRGLEILASEKNTRKELFLITDCQKNGWAAGGSAGWETVNQLLSNEKVQPRVYVVDVSRRAGENVTVTSTKLPSYPCGVGSRHMVEVIATSSVEKPSGRPVFTLFLDDETKEVARAEGSEFKGGESKARLVFSVDEPGVHWGKIEVQADCLEADNSRFFTVQARSSVPILCVDGGQAEDRFESGIAYLFYALAPEKGMGAEEVQAVSNILDPKVVEVGRFWEEELGNYEIVILSNVGTISGRMYESLADFVLAGGGLMVFLGENTDPVEYSARYLSAGKSFLPCTVGAAKGEVQGEEGEETGQKTHRISEVDSGHPAMALFQEGAGGDLSTAKFYKFFSVEADAADPDVKVLAKFDDGSPYLLERRYGRGRTLLFTSSCDLKWTNLPLKPAFLPLLHRLAFYMTGGADDTYALMVGEKIVERAEGGAENRVTLLDPAGARLLLVPESEGEDDEGSAFVSFEDTSQAGVYSLTMPDAAGGQGSEKRYFAVNVDTEESDLSVLEEKTIKRLIRWEEFRYLRAEEGEVGNIEEVRRGKEIWRFLVVAVVCFLVVESLLARQIDKG